MRKTRFFRDFERQTLIWAELSYEEDMVGRAVKTTSAALSCMSYD